LASGNGLANWVVPNFFKINNPVLTPRLPKRVCGFWQEQQQEQQQLRQAGRVHPWIIPMLLRSHRLGLLLFQLELSSSLTAE
jgi:hypothetical protein